MVGEKSISTGLVEAGILREPSALVLLFGADAEPELQNFIDAFHRRLTGNTGPTVRTT
jgi:hypothetical protein